MMPPAITGVNIDVGSVLSGIGTLAKDIRAAITGESVIDANKKAEIEMKLLEIENAYLTAQTEINKAEAANPNLFVSGWRPAAGWVCVIGFGYTFLLYPFVVWWSRLKGWEVPPEIDAALLVNLLFGMLGLAGMRTYEAKTGVKRTN
jgi:hypothetical protein